ncbi:pimeloyl-ACP methyl ester carboxylesterase [Panacagrimonas perspica]|uniref:Pimeloyl-ACP methyl ester carboxylesterase n=1 Tax=Panacagrimonas perspica TaxID=381431 RepID=A0A4R7P3R7_9GAMM|nr:alpha/beta hydrolase [Panacagrimonas perspica]TDU28405.1 pimeloyl-ACP methyl ester carboxylesterase [Panacagrimonas perspica]
MEMCWSAGSACVNGLQLHWEETGPARGEPLLLLMGLGGQLIHWPDALAADLVQRGFRVIRFDNRDSGLSGTADRGVTFSVARDWLRSRFGKSTRANYTLHDMAADSVGLLDTLGIERAHLVGASMGGMIAQIAAGTHPRRVKSLTSIMSSTNHPKLPSARFDVLLRMAGLGSRPKTREQVIQRSVQMLRRVGSPGFHTPIEYRMRLAGRAYDRAFRPDGHARQTHAILATGSFESLLPNIVAPTQVIHGLSDPLLRPACGRRSAHLIRGAKLELIPGMGHDLAPALMPRWAELVAANAARA